MKWPCKYLTPTDMIILAIPCLGKHVAFNKNYSHMKFDLKTLLIVIFAGACLWLSFDLKSNRQELADVAAELEQTNSRNRLLSYRLEIMQEAIGLNFGLNPILVKKPELSGHSGASPLALLYLRAQACSPCHIPVIRRLIDNAWQ